MVIHHPAKFGGHRYCCSGDMMFLGVEGQDSTYLPFSPPLLFISGGYGMLCSPTRSFRTQTQ